MVLITKTQLYQQSFTLLLSAVVHITIISSHSHYYYQQSFTLLLSAVIHITIISSYSQYYYQQSFTLLLSAVIHITIGSSVDQSVWFLPHQQTLFASSRLSGDHMSVGCGGPTLMLAKLYRLLKKLSAYGSRGGLYISI